MRISIQGRFWSKVEKVPKGCWLWIAGKNTQGYGAFWDGDRQVQSHRYSYEEAVGPIPDELQIDHLCRIRHCVKPSHMELVTSQENFIRGFAPTAIAFRLNRQGIEKESMNQPDNRKTSVYVRNLDPDLRQRAADAALAKGFPSLATWVRRQVYMLAGIEGLDDT